MAYSKEDVKRVVDEFQAKRKRVWDERDAHVAEIRTMLPAAYELETEINRAGPRMYEAALRGEGEAAFEKIKEKAVEIRRHRETLFMGADTESAHNTILRIILSIQI